MDLFLNQMHSLNSLKNETASKFNLVCALYTAVRHSLQAFQFCAFCPNRATLSRFLCLLSNGVRVISRSGRRFPAVRQAVGSSGPDWRRNQRRLRQPGPLDSMRSYFSHANCTRASPWQRLMSLSRALCFGARPFSVKYNPKILSIPN